MPFAGLRVLSLESRRAVEMAELIRRQDGDPFVAPSMRELPLEDNPEAFSFAERLFAGEFDMVILLTGVGTRALQKVIASRFGDAAFPQALRRIATVARGPKPLAALRELNVKATIAVPEPNTWRELLEAIRGRTENRIAVQEYGKSNPELLDALRQRPAEVTSVRVYQWALPEDTGPLREAVLRLTQNQVDVALFTTSIQIEHLFQIAAESKIAAEVRAGLENAVIASIGPTTSETLAEFGLHPDVTPSHPKMGFLVKEAAEQAQAILDKKRASHA